MKTWYLLLLCVCSVAVADDFPVPEPVPDPIGSGIMLPSLESIECEKLDEELGDLSDQIESLKSRIAKKKRRLAEVEQQLANFFAIQQQYVAANQPVPPGVTGAIRAWSDWKAQLNAQIRDLQAQLATVTARWSEAWMEWGIAGCGMGP